MRLAFAFSVVHEQSDAVASSSRADWMSDWLAGNACLPGWRVLFDKLPRFRSGVAASRGYG